MDGGQIFARAALLFAVRCFLILYKSYFAKLKPREAALAEASHGAALIVLPVVALRRFGVDLPAWVAIAPMILGGFWLFNGAKFAVGWRDPKLVARGVIKIALALWLFDAAPLLGWWLLVTGATKLLLVLRGFPKGPWVDPGPPPYGGAGFSNFHQ